MSTTYHSLASGNLTQNWANTGLITTNDDWSGVPSITGYLGNDVTSATGLRISICARATGASTLSATVFLLPRW